MSNWVRGLYRPPEKSSDPTHVRRMFFVTGYTSKLLLTFSNLVAFYAAKRAWYRSDQVVLLYACLSSFVHHSMEVRYYEPALWEVSERTAWWFLKNDRFGAVMAILSLDSWKLLRNEK